MCGVIGYVGQGQTPSFFYQGLKRLEYRGYDSTGIAMLEGGEIHVVRAEGKLTQLEEKLSLLPQKATAGIGHTRWATHGKPSVENAHPHRSGPIVLLHNGIIENYMPLKNMLIAQGFEFKSETDTEVVAHLLNLEFSSLPATKSPHARMQTALHRTVRQLKGAYAFAIMCIESPEYIYIAKLGSPLVLGKGEGASYLASGIAALIEHTREVAMLEDGDYGFISANEIEIRDSTNAVVQRSFFQVSWSPDMLEKGGYTHYMEKEIHEHPTAVRSSLAERITADGLIELEGLGVSGLDLKSVDRVQLIACGTSFYSGMFAKYVIEQLCKIPVEVDLASEYRYRASTVTPNTLSVAISQSGETIDTLFAIRAAKENGARTLGLVNVQGSTIAYACDAVSLLRAGPEIGVASTKALSSQMTTELLLALAIAQEKESVSKDEIREIVKALESLPKLLEDSLARAGACEELGRKYHTLPGLLYFGRGPQWAVALEGALKVKELAYIYAEAYAGGELKHGPIALVDAETRIVAIAPHDSYREKMISNICEIKARGGKIIGVGSDGDEELRSLCETYVSIPDAPVILQPFLTLIPIHLLAYWVAVHKGNDVDQPRNLAKSVTVE